MADHRSGTEPVTVLQALPLAIGDAQRLFGGVLGRRRWRGLALTAVMAGAVGVGVQLPPLGLLHPVWSDPATREAAFSAVRPVMPLVALLALLLIGFAVWARSFVLALVESIVTGADKQVSYRRYLGTGAAHYFWSACISLPLYALLFAVEAVATQVSWEALFKATEAEFVPITLQALLGFLAVLIPWVLLSLPLMVFQYELVPVVMSRKRCGPLAAAGTVLSEIRSSPSRFAGYFAGRAVFQFIGAGLMTVVAIPCLVVSAIVGSPILVGGGMLSSALGGWGTGAGAAVGSVSILLSCALFYCVTCVTLLPLTAIPFLLANRILGLEAKD